MAETIMDPRFHKKEGFTLVEVLVGTALFLTVAISAYGAFTSLFQLANANQARILAVELADEQFEIVRNMPYTSVGLQNGIPAGVLPQTQILTRGGISFTVGLTVRSINLSTSTVQASDKLVEVNVGCPTCKSFTPIVLTGQVSPANLQSASTGGALVVQVFDSSGLPIPEANVTVQSLATTTVTDSDVTNNNGILQIIGVPQGTNAYRITVTKAGYSTDRTYPIGGSGNPNPAKPDATVLTQQVTQMSFAIDRLSSLNFSSVGPTCAPVGSFHFSMVGSKQIGVGSSKYPLQNLLTNSSGLLPLSNMEWDTYTITPTDTAYYIEGLNPYSPLSLNPGNSQNIQLVVVPKNGNAFMASVQDAATKLPVSGAAVELSATGYDQTQITGQGYITQTDWTGGSGQNIYSDSTRYFADNGQIDTSTSSGNVVMRQVFGSYSTNATATLESSTFDTGTSSNFYTFSWNPISQPPLSGASSVKFQFSTNPTSTSTPWNYYGPDGTSNTYYTVPGSPINAVHNNKEFARYMAYLTTNTATVTPIVSNVSFAYTSACIPPGQVLFSGLAAGTYNLSISKNGYTSYAGTVNVTSGWQQQTVTIGP